MSTEHPLAPPSPLHTTYETPHETTATQKALNKVYKKFKAPEGRRQETSLCSLSNQRSGEYPHTKSDNSTASEDHLYSSLAVRARQSLAWEHIRIIAFDSPFGTAINPYKLRIQFLLTLPAARNLIRLWDWVNLSECPDISFELASGVAAKQFKKRSWSGISENQMRDLLKKARKERQERSEEFEALRKVLQGEEEEHQQ